MNRNAFIIHGTGGRSNENWFQWMKGELEQTGIPTIVPDFGTDEFPNVNNWKEIFQKYEGQIDENTILIGHSLGGSFLLKFLEHFTDKVYLLVTVGSPIGIKPIRFYQGDYDFLQGFDFNWDEILPKLKNKVIIHSDNDPYVSLGNGEKLAENLQTELLFIPDAGHFNTDSGYTEFPQLLEKINTYL